MKPNHLLLVLSVILLLQTSCKQAATDTASQPIPAVEKSMPDLAKIKAEIQAQNDTWAAAVNSKDAATITAFYADDAVSMINNQPSVIGKAAIQKDAETSLAKRKEGYITAFETMDVFGDENRITETGKTTTKDATGKVIYTGKYMAIWEKRDGKWLTIRDISNDDAKEK